MTKLKDMNPWQLKKLKSSARWKIMEKAVRLADIESEKKY